MKSSAAAGTMQIVNRTEFSELKTWLPNLIEQQAISDFFRQLDNLITLHQRKGKAAVTGCSNDANNSKGVYCKARDFGYKRFKKVESLVDSTLNCSVHLLCIGL